MDVVVLFKDDVEGVFTNTVNVRFDDADVETELWPTSTNSKGLISPSPIELVWRLMHSEKFVIREQGRQTLVFDVAGLAAALFPHRDKCNWIQP